MELIRERALPKLPPLHMEFFEELKFIHETGGFIFVHAGFRPGVPIEGADRA